MTGVFVDQPQDNDTAPKPPAPRHTAPNEAGVPRTAEELRKLRRSLILEYRATYEALGNS